MQAMGNGPTTPVEQITELGEQILEKLITAGITTVEELADMTPEQLEEVPGIGEKTVEKISTAVRHYFGHYEEGEERPVVLEAASESSVAFVEGTQEDSVAKDPNELSSGVETPEELLAEQAGSGEASEVANLSTEDIAAIEELNSANDGFSDADNREAGIELDNDTIDQLVDEAQEVSDEGIDEGHDRG
jgi:N utilization substance protein A